MSPEKGPAKPIDGKLWKGNSSGTDTALNTDGRASAGDRDPTLPLLVYVANWLKAAGCDPVSGGSDSRRTPCGRSSTVERLVVAQVVEVQLFSVTLNGSIGYPTPTAVHGNQGGVKLGPCTSTQFKTMEDDLSQGQAPPGKRLGAQALGFESSVFRS